MVGSGVAGMVTALRLAPLPVLLVTGGTLGADGSSVYAQGGIAASVAPDDDPTLHATDTIVAGAGLTDPSVALSIAAEGPAAIDMLARWGVPFDREPDGTFSRTLEAAHGRRRIVHAGGDAIGAALVGALHDRVRAAPTIRVVEQTRADDILVDDGRVAGIVLRRNGTVVRMAARAVVLATGGVGALYAATTNPPSNWGSGLALAARAGVVLRDLEFVQFHPTAIAVDGSPGAGDRLPLASEAVRGEGAVLVDDCGLPVMAGIEGGDLAPRDRVARAIWERMAAGHRVFLDARAALGARFPRRFPEITALCRAAGIDPVRQPIPVRPAAHYHMGGIGTDLRGRTSLCNLWAVGEVAATGLHGANRLASNSLLEATVLARRAAADIKASSFLSTARRLDEDAAGSRHNGEADPVPPAEVMELRRRMEAGVGVVRDHQGLEATIDWLASVRRGRAHHQPFRRMVDVALMIAIAARERTESRGAHARRDFPGFDSRWDRHWMTPPFEAEAAPDLATAL